LNRILYFIVMKHFIKNIVQFPEQTTVLKEQSESVLFDIYSENVKTNKTYCQALIDKIFNLPYAKLPEFFSHHCIFLADPAAKLPMMYVNAECEDRYFSFKETKKKIPHLGSYTDKIMFLTKEKFDYEQASIDFINPKLPDYSSQCQKEIDQIQHINRLTNEFSLETSQSNIGIMPHNKLKINCNINQLVDVYYQLHRELFTDGKPIIDGHINDITAVIVNSFVDKDGRELSPQTIRTLLTPSRTDKRPKPHKRIDIDKLL